MCMTYDGLSLARCAGRPEQIQSSRHYEATSCSSPRFFREISPLRTGRPRRNDIFLIAALRGSITSAPHACHVDRKLRSNWSGEISLKYHGLSYHCHVLHAGRDSSRVTLNAGFLPHKARVLSGAPITFPNSTPESFSTPSLWKKAW